MLHPCPCSGVKKATCHVCHLNELLWKCSDFLAPYGCWWFLVPLWDGLCWLLTSYFMQVALSVAHRLYHGGDDTFSCTIICQEGSN